VRCLSRSDRICRSSGQVSAQGSLPINAYIPETSSICLYCLYLLGLYLLGLYGFLVHDMTSAELLVAEHQQTPPCMQGAVIMNVCVAEMPPWCIEILCLWLASFHCDCGKSCQHSPADNYAPTQQTDLLISSIHCLSIFLSHKSMTVMYHHYEDQLVV